MMLHCSQCNDTLILRPLSGRNRNGETCGQVVPSRCPIKVQSQRAICFSPYLYRARNLVERFFNRIKQCRRVATRYDKLAANDLAFVQLASIRLWLRFNESTPLGRPARRFPPNTFAALQR